MAASGELGRERAFPLACAAVAERLGLCWDAELAETGACEAIWSALDEVAPELLADSARLLGDAYQAVLASDRSAAGSARKRSGAYYTPPWLVEHVLDTALGAAQESAGPAVRVLDPACGSGVFLVAAQRRGGRAMETFGIDIDPVAVQLARFALWVQSGGTAAREELERRVACIDALLADFASLWPGVAFDAVVGNPPFLNQLETGTAHQRGRAAALRKRYGEVARCYADASAIFLELGARSVRPGGRVAMVQPQSLLASRDAAPVRRSVLERCSLTELWATREHAFGASVLVCVPTLQAGGQEHSVRRCEGQELRPLPEWRASQRELRDMQTWAPLLAPMHGIPEFSIDAPRLLGDFAAATADFRDQFYGLRGRIVEDADLDRSEDASHPRLITTGLIDPANCAWGERPTRIDKHSWERPRLSLPLLESDPELLRWARARLVPKILLATQTRVLEAAVDERGEWIPVTPLITLMPRNRKDLWNVAAALSSPVLSAWALREYAGAGLSASAIKLSAKQVLGLPAPLDHALWSEAGELFQRASAACEPEQRRLLESCGQTMCAAYLLDGEAASALMAWWRARLPGRVRGANRSPTPS